MKAVLFTIYTETLPTKVSGNIKDLDNLELEEISLELRKMSNRIRRMKSGEGK